MPVNPDQARMLASLAADCRPAGARRWDPAGIVANIGKVKDRQLADVAMAVLRAAADRGATTPGVIPTTGPHWNERLTEPPTPGPGKPGADGWCESCGYPSRHFLHPDDHPFSAKPPPKPDPERVAALVAEAKAAIPRSQPRPQPKTLDEMTSGPRVQALKAEMAAARVAAATAIAEHEEAP